MSVKISKVCKGEKERERGTVKYSIHIWLIFLFQVRRREIYTVTEMKSRDVYVRK